MTRPFRLLPLLALFASACAGSVKFDELDGFGLVQSGVWYHVDDGDAEYDGFVLANSGGYCEKMVSFYEVLAEYDDASEDASEDPDSYCDEMEEPTMDMVDAASALLADGLRVVEFGVRDEDGDSDPSEDEYEVGDDNSLGGSVTYYEGNPYEAYEDWDTDAKLRDNCGVDLEDVDYEDYYEAWSFDDGSVTFTSVEDESAAKGELDVDLVTADEDQDDAGSMQASFTAKYCSIDL